MLSKIRQDMQDAMRKKDMVAANALRMVLSAVSYAEVAKKGKLDEGEVIGVIQKAVKTRKESIEEFKKGGRQDLVDKETKELAVLERYLPQQLSAADMEALVAKVIAEVGATSMKDMSKVMKEIMAKHKGQVDGKVVQQFVVAKLKA